MISADGRGLGIASAPTRGHAIGMKVAVSIPDDVFEEADALDAALVEVAESGTDPFVQRAAAASLGRQAP